MQQYMTDMRKRLDPRAQWLQLGVISASALAPLLSRWNDLRASERARALRVPWSRREARQQVEEIVRQVTERMSGEGAAKRTGSAWLWLLGAGIGVVVAGAGAYVLVRRQLRMNAEELVVLPEVSPNGYGRTEMLNGQAAGEAVPAAPARQTAPAAVDQPVAALAEQAMAPEAAAPEAVSGPIPTPAPQEYAGVQDVAAAKFIGNIHTMIYHEADRDPEELPAEENRIYFMTEEEARAAGYRRDREEVLPPEAQAQANE